MIGLGCGIEAPGALLGLLRSLPSAGGFLEAYRDLMGGLPSYVFPTESLLPRSAGLVQVGSGWTVLAGQPVAGAGRIAFPTSASTQRLRHSLAATLPAGTRVRVQWLQAGQGAVRPAFEGTTAPPYRSDEGWAAVDLVLGAPANRLVVECQGGNVDAAVTAISVVALATPMAHDIVVLMGGANMTGESSGEVADPDLDAPHPLVDHFADGAVVAALAPLQHRIRHQGLGPAMSFARRYADGFLPAGRRVLLVAGARGGSALVDPVTPPGAAAPWHPLNGLAGHADLFGAVLADAQAALALNPSGNRVILAWWSGGETDTRGTFQAGAYQSALRDWLIPAFRAGLGLPDLPFVISGTNPAVAPPPWLAAEAQLDAQSGSPLAVPSLIHVPWDSALGDGTRPGPAGPHEALFYSGSANRVRGAQVAQATTSRIFELLRLRWIAAADVITTDIEIAAQI